MAAGRAAIGSTVEVLKTPAPAPDHSAPSHREVRAAAAGGKIPVPTPAAGSLPIYASEFPEGFSFGAASSSYQVEGAWNEDGKGESCWDWFCHNYPERMQNRVNGDIATDFYHRYEEDLKCLKEAGFNSYRFSICWPRIVPSGSRHSKINQKGIDHYHKVLDKLDKFGIKPFVTLLHSELPQAIEEKYNSVLDPEFVEDYLYYVDVCFREYGDKVKQWITINEPPCHSKFAYSMGVMPPMRCSSWMQQEKINAGSRAGDSSREPYQALHIMVLAHAAAVHLYRDKYKKSQKGEIGVALASSWFLPYDPNSKFDIDACDRSLQFSIGWFLNPITQGDYPRIMRHSLGDRLPKFDGRQSNWIKGTYDFIAFNYYTSSYGEHDSKETLPGRETYESDIRIITHDRNSEGVEIPNGIYPEGFKAILLYLKNNYRNPKIYIAENGIKTLDVPDPLPMYEHVNDKDRISYHLNHLKKLKEAITEGVTVKGYVVWSLTDSLEWNFGYTRRFGLIFVDYQNDLQRTPKTSYYWFKEFLTHYRLSHIYIHARLDKRKVSTDDQTTENGRANANRVKESSSGFLICVVPWFVRDCFCRIKEGKRSCWGS